MNRGFYTLKIAALVILSTVIFYFSKRNHVISQFTRSNAIVNEKGSVGITTSPTLYANTSALERPTLSNKAEHNNKNVAYKPIPVASLPVVNNSRYKLPPLVKSWFPISHDIIPLTVNKDFLITPTDLCTPPSATPIDYLVVVHSAVGNAERRQGIRDTYGQTLFKQPVGRLVFLLGTTENLTLTQLVQKEAGSHNDIVVGDFHDSYHNLTLKGVAGLKWTHEFCPGVKMVIKVDDDVFVNIFKLIRFMKPPFINKTRQLQCLYHPAWTKGIERDGTKWHVEKHDFKGLEHFPVNHCDGFFVIISGDLIRPLLEAAHVVPFFWIDDVYLFGLLPYTIGDVDIVSCIDHLTFSTSSASKCMDKFGIYCTYYAVTRNYFSIKHFHHMWTRQKKQVTEAVRNWFNMVEDFPVNTNMDEVINIHMPGFGH